MPYPLLQFVSAPESTATVRYDFNFSSASLRTLPLGGGDLDLGVPTYSGDPESVGAEYGYRQMQFTQRIIAAKETALARMSVLAKELLRSTNWLKYQHDSARSPVYFKTYRGQPGSLSLEWSETAQAWDISVPLTADAFACGSRVTLAAITITNNPASGTNPVVATLPTIKGDAPAPLRIEVNPSNANDLSGYKLMFSLLSTESSITTPIYWNVGGTDGWTAGTDTGASVSDTAYIGGNYRSVSFATNAAMETRISGQAPATVPAGTYKVLVRVARSDTDSTFAMRFGQSVAFSYRYGDTVFMRRAASSAAGHATWVDLGEFTHPWGHNAPAGQEGFAATPNVSLQAQRLSGSGALRVDAFLLVPVSTTAARDCKTLFADFPVFGIDANGGWGVFDGDTESVWGFNQFAVAAAGMVPELAGQFPAAIPGAVNTLHMLQQVNGRKPFFGSDTSDSITATSVLTISYLPRLLYIGDGT